MSEKSLRDYKEIVDTLAQMVTGHPSLYGESFFAIIVNRLASIIAADYVFIGEYLPLTNSVKTLKVHAKGAIVPNFEYSLLHTPCAEVIGAGACSFQRDICTLYPQDQLLQDMKVEGYSGLPLFYADKSPLGVIVALFESPIEDIHFVESVIQLVAYRVASEFERGTLVQELREKQQYNRNLFEKASTGLALCSMDGVIKDVNQAYADIIGYTIEEVLHLTYWQVTPEKYASEEQVQLEVLKKTGSYGPYEKEYIHKSGILVPVSLTGSIIEIGGEKFIWSSVEDITDRKRSEQAFLESETTFRKLFEDSSDPILLIDISKVFVECNQAALDLMKMTREQFLYLSPLEISPPFQPGGRSSEEAALEMIELAYKNGHHRFDWTCLNAENEEFTVDVSLTPILFQGELMLHTTWRDITYRKQMEEALRKSEERFNLAMKASQDGVFDWDLVTNEIYYSPGWKRMLGYEDHELPNDFAVWETNVLPEDRVRSWELQKKLLAKEVDRFELEFKMKHKEGYWVDILSRAEAVFDENDVAVRIVGTHVDISARKRGMEALRKAKSYISNIINSMPSIIIGVDEDGTITHWNSEAERSLGLFLDEVVGRPLESIPHLAGAVENVHKAIRDKEVRSETRIMVDENKKNTYEKVTVYPLMGSEVSGAVIRIDNVNREYELQEQLNQSRKMDAIGQLAGGVAHDFNNMLGGIMGAADLLESPECGLNAQGLEYVGMILDASSRAAELTAKLLAFGRKGKMRSAPLDMHTVIDDAIAILRRTIDKKIHITVSKGADNSIVIGDISALQSSLLNLGINASHAMPEGGELRVETKNILLDTTYCENSSFALSEGVYLAIEIRDTGSGIPQENLSKIFEPFFTTKEQGKGTGLGLASVYGIIQDHYGEVQVESQMGKGTAFHLLLPCSEDVREEELTKEIIFHGSGTILLVDDEKVIRSLGQLMLEKMGFSVLCAANGLEAVALFQEHHAEIDLVVMDMIMPEMSGVEAFYQMKAIDGACKVVISSGFTKDENLQELQNAGLVGFIQKPFRMSGLSNILASVLGPA